MRLPRAAWAAAVSTTSPRPRTAAARGVTRRDDLSECHSTSTPALLEHAEVTRERRLRLRRPVRQRLLAAVDTLDVPFRAAPARASGSQNTVASARKAPLGDAR